MIEHDHTAITISGNQARFLCMIKMLKAHNRWNEVVFLGLLSVGCFGVSLFRVFYSESSLFLFLNWNLFLSFIPWAITSFVMMNKSVRSSPRVLAPVLFIWVLFFPNAPYILTDLFHLKFQTGMPIWFDLILILSFAWTGLMFGMISLWDIESLISRRVSQRTTSVFVSLLLFVGSFGIYVGRYLRWNSWDILQEPFGLLYDIGDRMMNPFVHPRAWGMTLFMGIFLNIVYWSFKMLRNNQKVINK